MVSVVGAGHLDVLWAKWISTGIQGRKTLADDIEEPQQVGLWVADGLENPNALCVKHGI